jgi:hypothetical protein
MRPQTLGQVERGRSGIWPWNPNFAHRTRKDGAPGLEPTPFRLTVLPSFHYNQTLPAGLPWH